MLWVLTGTVNSGKSRWAKTLVSALKQKTNITIGGIINNALFENNLKVGYLCESLLTGVTEVFARRLDKKGNVDDIICGQWIILGKGMRFAQQSLSLALKKQTDLVVIDEFGPLEKAGKGLRKIIDAIIRSPSNVLIIVRKSLLNDFSEVYEKAHPQIIDIEEIGLTEESMKKSMPYKWFTERKLAQQDLR